MNTAISPTVKCRACRDTGARLTMRGMRRCRCTPAPEKPRGEHAATHEGECGVCERRFSVSLIGTRLARHGFQRPGTGWLVGACPGQGHLPVERSAETLELLRSIAMTHADQAEATLERLRSPSLMEWSYQKRRPDSYNLSRAASCAQLYETVTIVRGAPADYKRGLPSFDDLLQRRVRDTERELEGARTLAARAEKRIAAWQLAELRVL